LVETIRDDTVFVPYHWAGDKSINRLTSGHLDPVSKIPEFKVCAVRLEPTGRSAPLSNQGPPQTSGGPHTPAGPRPVPPSAFPRAAGGAKPAS
jgi:predicted molibdopterin-dependent oxidoreductase YjgC